jgi:hypothetical protein
MLVSPPVGASPANKDKHRELSLSSTFNSKEAMYNVLACPSITMYYNGKVFSIVHLL